MCSGFLQFHPFCDSGGDEFRFSCSEFTTCLKSRPNLFWPENRVSAVGFSDNVSCCVFVFKVDVSVKIIDCVDVGHSILLKTEFYSTTSGWDAVVVAFGRMCGV